MKPRLSFYEFVTLLYYIPICYHPVHHNITVLLLLPMGLKAKSTIVFTYLCLLGDPLSYYCWCPTTVNLTSVRHKLEQKRICLLTHQHKWPFSNYSAGKETKEFVTMDNAKIQLTAPNSENRSKEKP